MNVSVDTGGFPPVLFILYKQSEKRMMLPVLPNF